MTGAARRGIRAKQRDATRARLLKVARRVFAERGYDETPVGDICKKAKVTHGALYHHFPGGKLELFGAVVAEVFAELGERVGAAVATHQGWEGVRAACDAYLDACADPDTDPDCPTGCGPGDGCEEDCPFRDPDCPVPTVDCTLPEMCEPDELCFIAAPETIGYCTNVCVTNAECPAGRSCEAGTCLVPEEPPGGGCSVGGKGAPPPLALGLFVLLLWRRRRVTRSR